MADKLKRFVIIDGKSVFYRGYYAMPDLKTKDGIPTGGVYGFTVMALEVLKKLKPDYVCVAWDKPKTNIRKRLEIYPQYKAGRKPAPPDFYLQIPILHRLLNAFGWPLYELDDYEADDIMGTLSYQAEMSGVETFLVTSDLDILQLIDDHTKAYILKKGLSNIEEYNAKAFEDKHHIRVDQFLDYKSLVGDSSDNIPGVPGIGLKTATDLLNKYQSLDEIYKNIELINNSIKQKLVNGKDSAYMSQKLAQIWLDAPLKFDVEEVDGSKANPDEIKRILTELEFRSLIIKLPEIFNIDGKLLATSSHEVHFPTNVIVDQNEKISEVKLSDILDLVVYGRAKGKHGHQPKYLNISPNPNINYLLILDKLDAHTVIGKLNEVIANSNGVVGYDLKNIFEIGYNLGVDFEKVNHDILIGSFLINPSYKAYSITELAQDNLGYVASSLDDITDEEFVQKSAEVIGVIREVANIQKRELDKLDKLKKLANEIEWKIIPVLARMEYLGIKIDTKVLSKLSTKFKEKISDLQQMIYGYADEEFNINSPIQLAQVLYIKLKLPTIGVKKGKNGLSTGVRELDKLRGKHPIINLITTYREYTKLLSTYVDTLPIQVDDESRLHTSFNLTIAQTGRLSSTDPNLQNIPIRSELGREIRAAFVAKQGYSFISADYSQFELRLAAYLANDTDLITQFNDGADIHAIVASQITGTKPEEVSKEMRRFAKTINFGILYGMSPYGLSVATDMTQLEAKKFIDRYYELRKPLINYMNKLIIDARKNGYVENLFGRRRPIPEINSPNYILRKAAERAAINMPVQGTAADLMKLSMIHVAKKLEGREAEILLQIHDSILVECEDSILAETEKMIKDIMEKAHPIKVNLVVETGISKNWGNL